MKCSLAVIVLLLVSKFAVAQLSGQYTIGGGSPDYSTIQSAVNALHSQGTSAPVEFLFRGGTYNDQITINDFTSGTKLVNIVFIVVTFWANPHR